MKRPAFGLYWLPAEIIRPHEVLREFYLSIRILEVRWSLSITNCIRS